MKILLDNGAYTLRNMGDVAMLQVSVKRVRALAPGAEIMILTTAPELLNRYFPGTVPLSVRSRDYVYKSDSPATSDWAETWARLKLSWRSVPVEGREFMDAFEKADAVFLCGGGFLNDINPYQTRPVLRMMTDAARRGKRVALFSQGLGPLENPELLGLLKRVAKAGVQTALRENCYGPKIMNHAGIGPDRYVITGDDALEMAWEKGPALNGNAVGFSIRQVSYSEVEPTHLQTVAQALRTMSKRLGTKIVPIPISFNGHEKDHETIAQVTESQVAPTEMDSPEALIDRTGQCKVLVTGTYHAAVFGLARGIPCVCFYVSTYYRNKLEGLARQFPGGCEVVNLNNSGAGEELVNRALHFWNAGANALSPGLLKSAEHQVQSSRTFYETVMASKPRGSSGQ